MLISTDFVRAEDARLRDHFEHVLHELRTRDVSRFSRARRARRGVLIDELARYARAGRFPRNTRFDERVPSFVDDFGTRCAMAHLIESTGEAALVARVATTRNEAYVAELAGDATLRAWLDHFGLDGAEAARIQPEYCRPLHDCVCAPETPTAAHAEVVVAPAFGESTATVRILEIAGVDAGVAPGDELVVEVGAVSVGDTLLLRTADTMWTLYYDARVEEDGLVALWCLGAPAIHVSDFIAAAVLPTSGGGTTCREALVELDPAWNEVRGANEGELCDGGCRESSVAGGGIDPVALLGVAAVLLGRRVLGGRGKPGNGQRRGR